MKWRLCSIVILQNIKAMKKFMNANAARKTKMVVLLVMMFFASSLACAQNEPKTAKPLVGVEVVRKVALLDIEGKYYQDVVMSFKPVAPDDFIASKYRVRMKVVDNTGKSIYKKTFRDVFFMCSQMDRFKWGNLILIR